ncbi:MAG TPA: hypothetical protein DDZ89_09645 [Clostridiales bacterium]|nr:hypothetical protein [Clostridiales bacterium]
MVDKNKKETKFKKFLNENKSLAVMLPIFVVLLGIVLYIYVFSDMMGPKKQVSNPQTTQPPVVTTQKPKETTAPVSGEVTQKEPETTGTLNLLPIRERVLSELESISDPFSSSAYKLKGIVYSEKGISCCIISTNGKSYILEENQSISDVLTVIKIEKESVTVQNSNGNNGVLHIFE